MNGAKAEKFYKVENNNICLTLNDLNPLDELENIHAAFDEMIQNPLKYLKHFIDNEIDLNLSEDLIVHLFGKKQIKIKT